MREASRGFVFSAQDALDRAVRDRERREREVAAVVKDLAAHRLHVERLEEAAGESARILREERRRLTAGPAGAEPDPWAAKERIASLRSVVARNQVLLREAKEKERAMADVLGGLRTQLAHAADAQRLLEQVREARLREFKAHGRHAADREADDAAIEAWRRGRASP